MSDDPGGSDVALGAQIERAERLLEERRLGEALTEFDVAETMGADADGCAAARWLASMLAGYFPAAWRESDAIRLRGADDPHRFWKGEEVRGRRVMVRSLHGFGDAVQFLRFLPRLNALAEQVVVEVAPRMVGLTRWLRGAGEVITWGEEAPTRPPAWDVQVEVTELPYLFRLQAEELPVATRYLEVPEECVRAAGEKMGGRRRLRVGLVWAAGDWNRERSVPLERFEGLLRGRSAEFWSLQGGVASAQAAEWIGSGLMRDAAACGDGLCVLAAVIRNLDLVITVDTLAAHLAGAMGVPAWVMLQSAADWRWMTEREDSPWYPESRLFRQARQGDWDDVIARVQSELAERSDAAGEAGRG